MSRLRARREPRTETRALPDRTFGLRRSRTVASSGSGGLRGLTAVKKPYRLHRFTAHVQSAFFGAIKKERIIQRILSEQYVTDPPSHTALTNTHSREPTQLRANCEPSGDRWDDTIDRRSVTPGQRARIARIFGAWQAVKSRSFLFRRGAGVASPPQHSCCHCEHRNGRRFVTLWT